MPRNTGSQPGAMVTDERYHFGSGVVIALALVAVIAAAYAFWPLA